MYWVMWMKKKEVEYKIEEKEPMLVRESVAMNYTYQAPIHAPSIYIEEEIAESTSFLSDQLVGIIATDINEEDIRVERLKRQ